MLTKLRALGDQLHQEVHKKVDLYESYFIDNYDFKQTLGSGAFGLVMEAEKKITQARVAVKRVKLPTNKEENEKTLREVQLLAKLGTIQPYLDRGATNWLARGTRQGSWIE